MSVPEEGAVTSETVGPDGKHHVKVTLTYESTTDASYAERQARVGIPVLRDFLTRFAQAMVQGRTPPPFPMHPPEGNVYPFPPLDPYPPGPFGTAPSDPNDVFGDVGDQMPLEDASFVDRVQRIWRRRGFDRALVELVEEFVDAFLAEIGSEEGWGHHRVDSEVIERAFRTWLALLVSHADPEFQIALQAWWNFVRSEKSEKAREEEVDRLLDDASVEDREPRLHALLRETILRRIANG